jgi:hypothetical protein
LGFIFVRYEQLSRKYGARSGTKDQDGYVQKHDSTDMIQAQNARAAGMPTSVKLPSTMMSGCSIVLTYD